MPKTTPFYSRTSALNDGQSWLNWSGYLSAGAYDMDHSHEYVAVRTSSALFDVSPLFKYHVRGRDALAMLNRVVTRDLARCSVGKCVYTTWCNDDGKVIDDGTIARLGEDFFRLTSAIPALHWLQDNSYGFDLELEDVSDQFGALALQGPTSHTILKQLTACDIGRLEYFGAVQDKIGEIPVTITRTGYTGDLGYEIFVEASRGEPLWDAMMEVGKAHGIHAAGHTALDIARIEAGLILIDVDFMSATQCMFDHQWSTPYELGLSWTVNLKKDYFIGQDVLRKEKENGSAWHTVGLHVDAVGLEKVFGKFGMPLQLPYISWADEIPIYAGEDQRKLIGKATSGTWSPILKKYVVIARVKPQYSQLDTRVFMEVSIDAHRLATPATIVKMPFYDPPQKKALQVGAEGM
jgi:aminomethyltransferase